MVCTRTTVGANIVRPQRDRSLRKERPQRDRSLRKERPQHDRSLCKERPGIRLTIVRAHSVRPYGYACEDGLQAVRPLRDT